MNIKDFPILDGWYNKLIAKKHPALKAMFDYRYDKCKECPYRKSLIDKDLCGKCGCPIATKLMAYNAECPIGKWTKINDTLIDGVITLKEKDKVIYNGTTI
jgi:hypothetical protein